MTGLLALEAPLQRFAGVMHVAHGPSAIRRAVRRALAMAGQVSQRVRWSKSPKVEGSNGCLALSWAPAIRTDHDPHRHRVELTTTRVVVPIFDVPAYCVMA